MTTRLGWLAEIQYGFPFDSSQFERDPRAGHRIVRIRDLKSNHDPVYSNEDPAFPVDVIHGDLIVGMDGDFNVAVWQGSAALLNQRVARIRARPCACQQFLKFVMPGPLRAINSVKFSTTVKHLSDADLRKLPVPDLELDQQRMVAGFLDRECTRINELIGEAEAARKLALEVASVGVDEALLDAPRVRLKHLGYEVQQGWSPDCSSQHAATSTLAVLRLSAVSSGIFDPTDYKALDERYVDASGPFLLQDGDLLLVRASGSLRLLGAVAQVEGIGTRQIIFPDLMYRLVARKPVLQPELLRAILQSRAGRDAVEATKRGAANNKLRIQDVREIPLPVPSDSNARVSFSVAVKRMDSVRLTLGRELDDLQGTLRQYRDALITEAITGKLDVAKLSEAQMDESLAAVREGERSEVLSS